MNCPKCNKIIDLEIDGGICFQIYIFCSPNCLFSYYTLNQLKLLI